jgi:hypothetical protein
MFNSNIHYAHTFTLNLFKTKVLGTRYIFIPLPMIETRFISLVFLAVEPTQLSCQLLVLNRSFREQLGQIETTARPLLFTFRDVSKTNAADFGVKDLQSF